MENDPLSTFITNAKDEIGQGNIMQVLEKMNIFFQNSPTIHKLIQQQNRLNHLSNQIKPNTLSFVNQDKQKKEAALELLDALAAQDFSRDTVRQEVKNAISIVNSKNVVANSNITATNVHIGDQNINHFGKPDQLNTLKKSLLAQQKLIFKQSLIQEGDHLYIQLPKQKRVKETLSFNKLIHQSPKDLSDHSIEEIFHNECLDSMLILGAPGAGKSTLLTELGYKIATKTEESQEGLLPVFLNLTSWGSYSEKKEIKKTFWNWLKYELKTSYGIRGKEYEEILLSKQVVLLLDGLDEVDENERKSCLLAFNDFIFEHRIPIVITCRRIEYDLLKKEVHTTEEDSILRLNGAIEIMPISEPQMFEYLQQKGYEGIATSYLHSEKLRSVLNSPLWLSIAVNAYHNGDWKTFTEEPTDWKYQLMGYYENWILDKKLLEWNTKNKNNYTEEDVIHWTAWLAFTMKREKLSVFYLERMQPWYLPNDLYNKYAFRAHLALGIAAGLACSLALNLSLGFAITLAFFINPYLEKIMLQIFPKRFAYGLAAGLASGICGVLAYNLSAGLVMGMTMGIISYIFNRSNSKIPKVNIVEHFVFKPSGFNFSNLATGLLLGLFFGVIFGACIGLVLGMTVGLVLGTTAGLALGMTTGLSLGLEENSFNLKETLKPNQGIKRTLKYSLWALLPGLVLVILLFFLPKQYFELEFFNINIKLFTIVLAGVLLLILPQTMGAHGYIRHFIIRQLLVSKNYIPKKYVSFLNAACRIGYLKRIGGGYRFFHREFQEYLEKDYRTRFSSLYKSKYLLKGIFDD